MVKQESIRAVTALGSATRYSVNPKRVLIVEDDIDSVRSLAALVSDMGHHVSYAINGYAALEIAARFKPQLVLLDISMPGMDGYETCRRLKQAPGLHEARIFALSAYGTPEHRARSREAGCELHLLKPISPQTLFDLLESSPA